MTDVFYGTLGDIARRFESTHSRVEYIISSRGIKPAAKMGIYNVYHEKDVVTIGKELQAMRDHRERRMIEAVKVGLS